jgi:hypothetical protein
VLTTSVPFLGLGAFPLGRDVPQRQPDQFGRGVIIGKMIARFDDLPQLRMNALQRVGV